MRNHSRVTLVALSALLLGSCVEPDPPLNIVVIVIDDMGWTDAGVYGSSFYETPNIDRLARAGIRFTQFYTASSACSPTRASLMTGKHPARLDLTNWIGGEQTGGWTRPSTCASCRSPRSPSARRSGSEGTRPDTSASGTWEGRATCRTLRDSTSCSR